MNEHEQELVSELKEEVAHVLARQGYLVTPNGFSLSVDSRASLRDAHRMAKEERLSKQKSFLLRETQFVKDTMIDGADLDVDKIDPALFLVKPGSHWEKLFRWWNLAWWSLPCEKAYGRQMRYLVWDRYHHAAIGLIGLQSPILSWAPRDNYLGIARESKDYWVNQSMSAQRLGAFPPYNKILGGKLVAMLAASDRVRRDFRQKYRGKETVIKGVCLPANLLFITTTGAFGKSSVYNRLKFGDEKIAEFIGYSAGNGSFHVPLYLYERIIEFLQEQGVETGRGWGNGPSRKMRLIRHGMRILGYRDGADHNVKRAIYLFPLAKNLHGVIESGESPRWHKRPVGKLAHFWKERWALPHAEKKAAWRDFKKDEFLGEHIKELKVIV